jgi:hypothetical protein
MFVYLCLICSLCFGFYGSVKAQGVRFKDGLTVTIKTKTTPADSVKDIQDMVVCVGTTENTIHRLITDLKNKLYYGYDIIVIPQSETNKFQLSFKPLSINPGKYTNVDNLAAQVIPKYPDDILVEGGDTITLELLENPQTKVKLFDVLKITNGDSKGGDFLAEQKPARDFTIDDVVLQLTKMEVFVNGEKIGRGGGGMSGANIYIYLPDKGRFIMSPFPRKGFNLQKIGIAENNKISFSFNGDNYKIVSTAPVLGSGVKWNIWILHDPDYRSSYNLSPNSYEQGASDKIEFLFKKLQ